MRPVEFGEALPAATRLTLFSRDKPDRFFAVIKFWMDETSGIALALKTGLPTYQVEDEEGRIYLLLHLPIEEQNEDRWCLWRTDQAGLTLPLFLMARWLRNRKARVMEYWSVGLLGLRRIESVGRGGGDAWIGPASPTRKRPS